MDIKTTPEAIAKRIKYLREKNGETQNDLAISLGCNQNNISKIENGKSLTSDNLILIAEHYHVSMDYLCKGEGGIDLLDTIEKYIRYKLAKISGIDESEKTHLIPHIEINHALYNCLRQISLAKTNPDMPQKIKEQWIKEATEEFNNGIITDNYKNYISFVLLESSILSENIDVVKLIEKHTV